GTDDLRCHRRVRQGALRVPAAKFRRGGGGISGGGGEGNGRSTDPSRDLLSGANGNEARPLRGGLDAAGQNLWPRQSVLRRVELRFSVRRVPAGDGEGLSAAR